jgi:monofunctional chorismate mutase, high GC gram positive type
LSDRDPDLPTTGRPITHETEHHDMTAMIDIPSSILSAPTDATASGNGNDAAGRTPAAATTGASGPAVDDITGLRERIDEIDNAIIHLWQERAAISAEVGRVRIAAGGTRLVLSREREIVDRFRDALGTDGVQLALLILRAGRGPL